MVRTVISLEENDKKWLDRKAKEQRVTMTELIREAIRGFRLSGGKLSKSKDSAFKEILARTKGTWTKGDALEWHRKFQEE